MEGGISMKIKSYFAETVTDAVQKARKEMGEDAMLVESRKAPSESRHLGAYEVVFAVAGTEPTGAGRPPKVAPSPLGTADMARLSTEMTQMRRQLDGIRLGITTGLTAPRWLLPSAEFE